MLKFVVVTDIEIEDVLGGLLEWRKLMFQTILSNLKGSSLAFRTFPASNTLFKTLSRRRTCTYFLPIETLLIFESPCVDAH